MTNGASPLATAAQSSSVNDPPPARPWYQITTLRTRLLLAFTLIVLLTAVPITVGALLTARIGGQQQVLNQLESVASVKESTIETWLNGLQTSLASLLQEAGLAAATQALVAGEGAAVQQELLLNHLRDIQETTDVFDEIFLMDLDGRVVLSTDPEQIGKIRINQSYFQEGRKRPYNSAPFYSPSLQRLSLVAARPLSDGQGQNYAVIAGRADMEFLSDLMQDRSGLGDTEETYLVGANHGLLTSAKGNMVTEDSQLYVRNEGVNRALDERRSDRNFYTDFRGVPVAGYYNWYPRLQVVLVAEQNRAEAFQALNQLLFIIAAVTLFAVAAAIATSLFVNNRITEPIVTLSDAASQIEAEGFTPDQLDLEPVKQRQDEIGQFARVFDDMAGKVYAREQKLRRQVEELQIVIDRQKQDEEVAQLTDSEFFRELTSKAQEIRQRRRR